MAVYRMAHTGFFIGWTFYETIELLLLRTRESLTEVLGTQNELLLIVDVILLAFLCVCGCAVWCCVFRSFRDVALSALKLMLCAFTALTMGGLALTLFGLTARDHPRVGVFLNDTSEVVLSQSRKLADSLLAENLNKMFE